jgi:hypothetical protein
MAPFLDVRGVMNRMNVYDEFEEMCKETVIDVFQVCVCSSILAHTHTRFRVCLYSVSTSSTSKAYRFETDCVLA